MTPELVPDPGELTRDSLFDDRLQVLQSRQGYRFSMDAVLLAHFVAPREGERLVDLGTGCGILPLLLSYRHPGINGIAVEIQPRLARLARENIVINSLERNWQVEEFDFQRLAELLPAGSCDWAISNPPYRRAGSSRSNPRGEQAKARHELSVELPAVIAAMRHALKAGGRAALIYPAARAASLLSGCKEGGLEPKRLQVVYSYPGGRGKLVLVEARKGGGEELLILPPFYLHEKKGGHVSAEMSKLYQP
jgi:tRNA1Val (adenine37-N6)-methyltransferase